MTKPYATGYVALLAACLFVSLAAGWTELGSQFDHDVYDFLFRRSPPPTSEPTSIILGVDEASLTRMELGGIRGFRSMLAEGLERIADAGPRVVVIDLILADKGNPDEDRRLAAAFARARNLVLATNLVRDGWEDPLPEFSRSAAAIGHVHADPDYFDNIVRQIPLEKADGATRRRFWALSLEAFRLASGGGPVVEGPESLEVGEVEIAARRSESRPLRINFLQPPRPYVSSIPEVTFWQLRRDPSAASRVRDKVVFVGITAQSAAQDRHMTPYSYGRTMPGVEIHANAYETMAQRAFLRPASNLAELLFSISLCAAAGFIFWRFSGWTAYGLAAAVLFMAHLAPWLAFRRGIVFPYAPPFSTAWLSSVSAAAYQYFFVRRKLGQTQAEKERYQKAIHFVAHEMRTPLTAIQGSSELMGRYKLPDEKRAEMARMINSESKRLARMIQTFLDVERLSEGQMELKREPFDIAGVVETCLTRVASLADRKKIGLTSEPVEPATVRGDRELMEYAVYNLLTNAIKYSPAETRVSVYCRTERGSLRLSVRDQGIGMDGEELKNIFRKFYRTKKAEVSGEAGTGIGLSIVQQIVTHHGGTVEVTSQPGAGSCFTIVLPVVVPATT